MEKVKLEIKIPKNKTIEYNGIKIEITPFLTAGNQIFLFNSYINDYFYNTSDNFIEGSKYFYLNAEFNMMLYVMQLCTNIEVEGIDKEFFVDANFWKTISSEIVNYWDFRNKLNFMINEIKQQEALEHSVGRVLENIAYKLENTLEDVSKNISPEELEKLQKNVSELFEKMENSSVLKQ